MHTDTHVVGKMCGKSFANMEKWWMNYGWVIVIIGIFANAKTELWVARNGWFAMEWEGWIVCLDSLSGLEYSGIGQTIPVLWRIQNGCLMLFKYAITLVVVPTERGRFDAISRPTEKWWNKLLIQCFSIKSEHCLATCRISEKYKWKWMGLLCKHFIRLFVILIMPSDRFVSFLFDFVV